MLLPQASNLGQFSPPDSCSAAPPMSVPRNRRMTRSNRAWRTWHSSGRHQPAGAAVHVGRRPAPACISVFMPAQPAWSRASRVAAESWCDPDGCPGGDALRRITAAPPAALSAHHSTLEVAGANILGLASHARWSLPA
jgi:hypothetical protein